MRDYLRHTRTAWISFLLVLPLLVLYQATALVANLGQRRAVINGADALLQNLLNGIGLHGWLASWVVVAIAVGAVIYRLDAVGRASPFRRAYFPLVLGESALYALGLGSLVAFLTGILLPGYGYLRIGGGLDTGQKLAASLGAGLYEELVFRAILCGGLLWLLRRWAAPAIAAVCAVLLSSLVFSLFHYVGTYADPFQLGSFTFRFVAGVVLAGLFSLRGFAVVAWTHALYDVFLLVVGHA